MNDAFQRGFGEASALFLTFVPKLLLAVVVIVAAYFIGKMICKVLSRVLDKAGFNRVVERGGVKRALDKSGWDAGQIVSKTVFYFIMLFALQFAFGIFGPNPISDILTRIIAFLPNVLAAMVIVVLTAAIASGVRQLVGAALANLGYGRMVASGAAAAVLFVGISAALNQLQIAPAIVNGIFYAVLATLVGIAIVAVGGGGIQPMRKRWEKALDRAAEEAPKLREAARNGEELTAVEPAGTERSTNTGGQTWADEVEDQREAVSTPRRRRSPPRE